MFGSDQAAQNVNVTDFSRSGTNQDVTTSALQKIAVALPTSNGCNAWLQGAGVNQGRSGLQQIQEMVSANLYAHGTINIGANAAYGIVAFSGTSNLDGTAIPGIPAGEAVFIVNDVGGFYNATDNAGHNFTVGHRSYAGNTLRAQLAALVHEVAHQITVSDFQSDFAIPKAGKSNDGLVDANCRGLIEGPSIASVNPSSGQAGTTVTIKGKNFGTSQGNSTVTFNSGVAAEPASTWTDTQIVVKVPSAAISGNIVIFVGGAQGQSASVNFTVQP